MRIEDIKAWGEAKMRWTDENPLECGFRYYHGLRVASIAESLAAERGQAYHRETLFIGAFLHDVGKAGYTGPDHGPRGAKLIRDGALHLIDEQMHDVVLNIVANHYMRPGSSWLQGKDVPELYYETLLVQDADILDHFGATAVWTALRWSVHEGRNQSETIEGYHGGWLDEARRSLNFAESRLQLERRVRLQDLFYEAWRREQDGLSTEIHFVTGDERDE
ncbi:MAG TPA: HD domain-containing protein [Bacillota bacterium]|nr:HD domain-containing protein [Bacillota bacterium]